MLTKQLGSLPDFSKKKFKKNTKKVKGDFEGFRLGTDPNPPPKHDPGSNLDCYKTIEERSYLGGSDFWVREETFPSNASPPQAVSPRERVSKNRRAPNYKDVQNLREKAQEQRKCEKMPQKTCQKWH